MRQIAGALLLLLFVGLALAQTRMDTKTATLYLRWKYNGVNLTETAYWRVLAYPENEDTTSNAQDTLEYYATAVDTAWIHSPVEYDSYLYYAYNDTLGISLQLRADWLQAGPTAPYGFVDSSFAFCENVVGPYALIEDSSYVVTNLAADSVTIDSALTVPWISTDSLTADSAIVAAAAILTWAQIDSVIWGGDGLDTTNITVANWTAFAQAAISPRPIAGGIDTVYVSTSCVRALYVPAAAAGDWVIATPFGAPDYAPGASEAYMNGPYATGTGYRLMPAIGYCKEDSVIIGFPVEAVSFSSGDSLIAWTLWTE